jgi:hypothetical protein
MCGVGAARSALRQWRGTGTGTGTQGG